MAYNTKPIVTDKDGNPISQYYNPVADSYEEVTGSSGANKVLIENNDLSLIPILDKLSQLNGTVIDEETRKTNEVSRKSAETTRVSTETARKNAETGRVNAETDRVTKETDRVTKESTRVSTENIRVTNETARKSDETIRVSQENTRKTNETNRGIAESTREGNENTRKTNETTRGTNETARINAETTRGTNETNRVNAEGIRVSQEDARISNETARENSINEFKVWEVYNNTKTYKPLNKVVYQGSSYICILQSTGNLPTNSTYWLMIAQKGLDGQGSGDMLKSVYDTNSNGIVDKSEDANTVGGFTVGVNVPANAKFTDTIVDINGKADINYVDNKVKTDVPLGAKFTDTIYTHPTNHPASMITGLPTSLPASGGNANTVGGFTVGVNVPAGAKFTDTVYTHPVNHPPSIISQDSNNRFVTDTEKATWNGKSNFSGSYNDLSNKPTIPDTSTLMPKSGGVFTGIATAHSNTSYTVRQMRNIVLSTSDAVLASMQDGDIWIKYS